MSLKVSGVVAMIGSQTTTEMKRWGIKDEISLAVTQLIRTVIGIAIVSITAAVGVALYFWGSAVWNWCASLLK